MKVSKNCNKVFWIRNTFAKGWHLKKIQKIDKINPILQYC